MNPVVETQLIVDHRLRLALALSQTHLKKIEPLKIEEMKIVFILSIMCKTAFENVSVIPVGNGIMHQINLEKMSPVVQSKHGVAFPDTCVGTDSHTPHVDALGVIAIGVGGLEVETVMLGRP